MGDSTPRMQRHRAHADNDHSICLEVNCDYRRYAEQVNEYRLRAKVLVSRGVTDTKVNDLANLELPDYITDTPDAIHRLATETGEWRLDGWFDVYEKWIESNG